MELISMHLYIVLDLEMELAILLGAILVVTGPTVILPLLRHLRPSGDVGSILKWEGIVIDPIGAILAVIVFQVIIAAEGQAPRDASRRGATPRTPPRGDRRTRRPA